MLHNPGDRLLCFIVVVFFGGVPRTAWLPLLLLIFPGGSGRPFWAIVSTEELCFVGTEDVSFVETEDMFFVSTEDMSFVSTEDMSSVATEDLSFVSTEEMYFVETQDMSCVSTEDMSFVETEDVVLFWSHFGPRSPPHCCCFLSGGPEPVCGHCRRFFEGVVTQDS